MYIPSLHRRFYYTSRFKVTDTSGGQITLEDQQDKSKPITIVKTLTGFPVVIGKIYFIGLNDMALDASQADHSTGKVLSPPVPYIDTYVESGAQDYDR